MKVPVTGAPGFIGMHTTVRDIARRNTVVGAVQGLVRTRAAMRINDWQCLAVSRPAALSCL